MSDFDPNNPAGSEGDDLGGLAWNEFDWENYLREQEDVVLRYLGFYELLADDPKRVEKVAVCMGWAEENAGGDGSSSEETEAVDETEDDEAIGPYTVQKNYVFIATRAIYMSLSRAWERVAGSAEHVPQAQAIAFLASLHRGESNAVLAVHALDYCDYAMAVSLFKRALGELNRSLMLLDNKERAASSVLLQYRKTALPQLFDLREIWLQMAHDCRHAITHLRETDDDAGEL